LLEFSDYLTCTPGSRLGLQKEILSLFQKKKQLLLSCGENDLLFKQNTVANTELLLEVKEVFYQKSK
jgi:hypothetical protein